MSQAACCYHHHYLLLVLLRCWPQFPCLLMWGYCGRHCQKTCRVHEALPEFVLGLAANDPRRDCAPLPIQKSTPHWAMESRPSTTFLSLKSSLLYVCTASLQTISFPSRMAEGFKNGNTHAEWSLRKSTNHAVGRHRLGAPLFSTYLCRVTKYRFPIPLAPARQMQSALGASRPHRTIAHRPASVPSSRSCASPWPGPVLPCASCRRMAQAR